MPFAPVTESLRSLGGLHGEKRFVTLKRVSRKDAKTQRRKVTMHQGGVSRQSHRSMAPIDVLSLAKHEIMLYAWCRRCEEGASRADGGFGHDVEEGVTQSHKGTK